MTSRPLVAMLTEQWCRRPAGGIGMYASSLVRALMKHALDPDGPVWDVRTCSSRFATTNETNPAAQHRWLSTPHPVTVRLLSSRLRVPGMRAAFADAAVVHATSFDLPVTKQPMSVFVHDLLWRDWPDAYSQRGRDWHERALQHVVRSDAAVMVPSDAVRRAVIDAGVTDARVTITREGSDHLAIGSNVAQPANVVHPANGAPYVLSVATFQPRKNLAHLIDAVRVVRSAALPDLQLVLVGPNGWGEADVRRDEAGVLFLGQVSAGELGSLYAHASMLAVVSRGEGFGLPVYEAFHAGVPVLASRGVPAAVESDAALIVSGADIDETADAIVRLITDEQLRDRLTARGSRVAALNTWQHVASRHITVWDSLRVAG